MNVFKRKSIFAAAIAAALALASIAAPIQAIAATQNYGLNTPVMVIPFHVSGQYTATTTGVVKFLLPFKAKVIGVSANARASGGTTPTLTVDVLNGATTMLSAPISITAGTPAEGTITVANHADESTINVNFAITGTTPTWNDITIILTLVRI